MEFKDLSSNWKRLKVTLESEKPPPRRRKASEDLQSHKNGVKRVKATAKSPTREPKPLDDVQNRKMGVFASYLKPVAPSASLALWAEDNDIPAKDLTAAYGTSSGRSSVQVHKHEDKINEGLSSTADAGKYISMDCEMVGVGPSPDTESALARVSIVNYHGDQIYDSFVQPKEAITDYRTFVSGMTPALLRQARTFETVQEDVAALLDDKILIGHSVKNDLEALLLGHPKRNIRDTSRHPKYRQVAGGKTPGLKRLAKQILDINIQGGEHSSIEDARATMLLFRREKDEFEREHQKRWGPSPNTNNSSAADKDRARVTATTKKKKKKKTRKR
ncbi:MAG: hypothetical protein Q9223_000503 [Gallowayella weberi]